MVFYSHREAGILQVSGQCIDLAGKYTVQCRSHIQSPTSGTSRISQIEPGSQHCNGLFTPFISTHRSQLILHFRIIGRIDLKGQGKVIQTVLNYNRHIKVDHTRLPVLTAYGSAKALGSFEIEHRVHRITGPFHVTAIVYIEFFQGYHGKCILHHTTRKGIPA